MNQERLTAYIRARDDNTCQLQHPGCTHTCDTIALRLPLAELQALRRDPDSADNQCCACTNCAPEGS